MSGYTCKHGPTQTTDTELGLTGYVMFRRDQIGRRGGGVILYVKETIQAYEIKLEREADYDEAVWRKIVSGNSKLTIGLVYRSPNEETKRITQNAIKEVNKGECIIMGDFNHGHIQWKSLESTGSEDQQVSIFNSGELPYSARAGTNQGRKCIRYTGSFIITKRISGQCKNT